MEELSAEALFADLLRQSIIEALTRTLGKSTADRILCYLRLDALENIVEISPLLRSCCGRSAATWVESAILRRLCERSRLDWAKFCNMDFEESIALRMEPL